MQDKDREILEGFKSDPEQAFRLMFDTYYMPLCVYVVQLADSFAAAEDIVQETFCYFWEKRYYERVQGSLRGYLFEAVRNATLLYLRRNRLVSMEELSEEPVEFPEEAVDQEELARQEERLREAVGRLPRQEAEAVRLVIMESRRYREAAERMNVSVNTLKSYLGRALKKLRKEHNLLLFFC